MRTTIDLPDSVFRETKALAAMRGITMKQFILEAIEQAKKTVAVVCAQNQYNIGDRKSEDTLKYCEKHKLGFIPWFPVAAGQLARSGGPLDAAAKRHHATVAQLSLAWLLHHSPVTLPIPGTSSVAHLEENIGAGAVKLSADEWKMIESEGAKAK